ncbi:MAG: hypothetical protein ABFD10_03700 [Prolixibacteraceae bacterium]
MKIDEHKIRMERVVRWDSYRINQFSYTNNLLIGLNLAFLGFFITQSGFKINCNCFLITLQLLTVLLLLSSFLAGILTVVNRLQDFRKTSELTKKKKMKFEHDNNIKSYSDIKTIKSEVNTLHVKTRKLGKLTWILLKCQVWTFFIGTTFGIIYLIIE